MSLKRRLNGSISASLKRCAGTKLTRYEILNSRLNLLQSLHVMHAGNLSYAVDDLLQVFEVGDVEDYIDAGLAVLAAGFHAADVGFGVADDSGDLLEHAPPVIAQQRKFYGIRNRLSVFVSRPQYIDTAIRFVEKVGDVRAIDRVDGHAFATGDVAHDRFSANRVATAGAINQQVALSADDDGVSVAAPKDAAHGACKTVGRSLLLGIRDRLRASGCEFREHLTRRVFAVA